MRVPKLFLASAVAVTAITAAGAPSISLGIECSQLCKNFQPQHGVTDSSGYGCQDLINDSGGFCTIDGNLNSALDLPRPGIVYNKRTNQARQEFFAPDTRLPIIR